MILLCACTAFLTGCAQRIHDDSEFNGSIVRRGDVLRLKKEVYLVTSGNDYTFYPVNSNYLPFTREEFVNGEANPTLYKYSKVLSLMPVGTSVRFNGVYHKEEIMSMHEWSDVTILSGKHSGKRVNTNLVEQYFVKDATRPGNKEIEQGAPSNGG